MSMIRGRQRIGFTESVDGGETFHAVAPATGEVLEPAFHEATEAEIDRAMQLAGVAAGELAAMDGERRAALCDAVAAGLEADRDAILERCGLETAYPEPRLHGEFARTVNQLRLFGRVARDGAWLDARIDHADPARTPLPKPDVRRMLQPIGPVVVFGASNFPLALSTAGGDTASALAAGCPVVVKAHPSHPGTSELLARAAQNAIREHGFPEGTLTLLQGASHRIGECLVRHPMTAAVGFTGSLRGGRALFDLAASRPDPIPVYAEMGSVNPQFVLPGRLAGDPNGFAEALFASVTLGQGQFCTNPGLVFVCEGAGLDRFLGRLTSLVEESTPGPLLNRGIASAFRTGIERLAGIDGVSLARGPGAEAGDAGCRASAAVAVTTLADFERERDRMQDEVFGPSTVVVICPSPDDFDRVASGFPGQLASSIHGNEDDLARSATLLAVLTRYAGRVIVNGFPTGIEVCHSMHHGGPYPATTHSHFTSIGTAAIARWGRPVCYQDVPDSLLPDALRESNPLGISRLVDGMLVPAQGRDR